MAITGGTCVAAFQNLDPILARLSLAWPAMVTKSLALLEVFNFLLSTSFLL